MNTSRNPYAGHRYPAEIIVHAVWLCHRFRAVEDLLAKHGIIVRNETIELADTVPTASSAQKHLRHNESLNEMSVVAGQDHPLVSGHGLRRQTPVLSKSDVLGVTSRRPRSGAVPAISALAR